MGWLDCLSQMLFLVGLHGDLLGLRLWQFRQDDVQNAVFEGRVHFVGIHATRQAHAALERAIVRSR
jgi:hypothetical protein